jgi:hypothetical protein
MRTPVQQLFCDAIAWGRVYGPAIIPEQWDEMRDMQAAALVERLEALPKGDKKEPVVGWPFPIQRSPEEVMEMALVALSRCAENTKATHLRSPADFSHQQRVGVDILLNAMTMLGLGDLAAAYRNIK